MPLLQTPRYDLEKYPNVYEPREDSFLLLDALETELDIIKEAKPTFMLEVGSGSGVIISALADSLKNSVACFSTDINLQACNATQFTSTLNNVDVNVCNMNLFDHFKENIFDLVVFNPPYVVTNLNELDGRGLNRSWAGGQSGRIIIDIFLENLPNVLTENGVCYIVVIKENNVEHMEQIMNKRGYSMSIVMERKIPSEHLFVLKFYNSKINL